MTIDERISQLEKQVTKAKAEGDKFWEALKGLVQEWEKLSAQVKEMEQELKKYQENLRENTEAVREATAHIKELVIPLKERVEKLEKLVVPQKVSPLVS